MVALADADLRVPAATPWCDPIVPKLSYNGTDRTTRKPSIRKTTDDLLRRQPKGTWIEWRLWLEDQPDDALTGIARLNNAYFFLRTTRLPEGWPEPPLRRAVPVVIPHRRLR
jgi:hypothetical protein